MTNEKLQQLVKLAKANYEQNQKVEREKRESEQKTEFVALGDIAKPYIEKLFADIEEGAKIGRVEYEINYLPASDFNTFTPVSNHKMVPKRSIIKHNTTTSKILDILESYNLKYELCYINNMNDLFSGRYPCYIVVKL